MDSMLSFIIVEYFSIEEIEKCIAYINANLKVRHEIIVSSNSCYDAPKQQSLRSAFANKAIWVFNSKNGGFAYAMNCGLKISKGDFMVIMNSDCIIEKGLDNMMAFMEQHPEIGACGPQIKDGKGIIQDTARPYVTVLRYVYRQLQRVLEHREIVLERSMNYNGIQTVDWVIGAFIMVSRRAYQLTGGLDDAYFMYAEDLDWCTRIRAHGLEIVYYPKAVVRYKGTRRARGNKKYAKVFIQSHLRFWKKFGFFSGYPRRKNITF